MDATPDAPGCCALRDVQDCSSSCVQLHGMPDAPGCCALRHTGGQPFTWERQSLAAGPPQCVTCHSPYSPQSPHSLSCQNKKKNINRDHGLRRHKWAGSSQQGLRLRRQRLKPSITLGPRDGCPSNPRRWLQVYLMAEQRRLSCELHGSRCVPWNLNSRD